MKKQNKGVTLIALVITIIVLLILAGVAIATLLGEEGIIERAQEVEKKTTIGAIEETINLYNINKRMEGVLGSSNVKEEFAQDLVDKKIIKDVADVIVDEDGTVKYKEKIVGTINTESTSTQLLGVPEIGDYVNYHAGKWTSDDFDKIAKSGVAANKTASLPTEPLQFGGFIEGQSRDTSAVPYDSTYAGLKTNNETAETAKTEAEGWRIIDIYETDGKVTRIDLISAGNPEDFKNNNLGYESEYILSGEKKNSVSETTYSPRDWSMYVNKNQGATSATAVTKTYLDNWYDRNISKIDNVDIDNTDIHNDLTFRKIYEDGATSDETLKNKEVKYQTVIDNYTYHYLRDSPIF